MKDGIRLPDVAEEFVAQSFSLARPLHQACNVHDFDGGWNNVLWINQFRQFLKARVGHGDDTNVGLNRTKREIRALRLRIGKAIEKGGFTDVGEANNAAF